MSFVIPRPLRDIVCFGTHQPSFPVSVTADVSRTQREILSWESRVAHFLPRERVSRAALRIALAASAALVLAAAPAKTIVVAAVVGSFVSLPSVMIAAGSYILYQGVSSLIAAMASVHFTTMSFALANCAVGWMALEFYDLTPFMVCI